MLIRIFDPHQAPLIISGEKRQQTVKPTGLKKGSGIEFITSMGWETNIFGNTTITDVIKLRGGLVMGLQRETTQDGWAKREGFASFEDADKLFSHVYGEEWQRMEMDVIYFKGDWLLEEN